MQWKISASISWITKGNYSRKLHHCQKIYNLFLIETEYSFQCNHWDSLLQFVDRAVRVISQLPTFINELLHSRLFHCHLLCPLPDNLILTSARGYTNLWSSDPMQQCEWSHDPSKWCHHDIPEAWCFIALVLIGYVADPLFALQNLPKNLWPSW